MFLWEDLGNEPLLHLFAVSNARLTEAKRLADLRAMYEPYINVLSDYLLMPLPGWLPKPRAIDNWQTSAWEITAPAPEEPFRKCMRQDARRKSKFAAAE